MDICYFASGIKYNRAAGPSAHIVNIAKELNAKGDVSVELLFNGFTRDVPDVNFKLLNLQGLQETVITTDSQERVDDVAIRGLNPLAYLAYLINALRFFFRKKDCYDVFIERMWRLGGLCGFLMKRFSKKRGTLFILEENGPMKFDRKLNSLGNLLRYILHRAQRRYAMFIYNRADAIVVQTRGLMGFLVQEFYIGEKKIHVIPNGVDLERFSPEESVEAKKSVNFPPDKRALLYVGSIDSFHDLSEAVAAFNEIASDNMMFAIIGDGVKRNELLSQIKKSELKNISYIGPVPHDELPKYINASDICIAPYNINDFENRSFVFSPLKILEYMACAKIVISQPMGYIEELIDNGKGGFLVDNKRSVYAAVLDQLATIDIRVLNAFGEYNREKAMEYKWSVQADKYMRLINGMVS